MRVTGLVATTAIIAAAVAIVPFFRWAFLAIAMVPAALYGRSVVSADGMTLACAMMVIALTLRATAQAHAAFTLKQAFWMCLAALTKPPTIVLVLFGRLQWSARDLRTSWLHAALVCTPGVLAMATWTAATSADVGSWRLAELTGSSDQQFDLTWKLGFWFAHPFHFPSLLWASLREWHELWRQMIGVLGLFDIYLLSPVYPMLSILLVAACLTPTTTDWKERRLLAVVSAGTAVAYCLAVYLIFYLKWTPLDAEQIWGVQGRYFLPALPLMAIAASSLGPGLPERVRAAVAVAGAVIAGLATVEAIARVDWALWG
jgi:uncharacterized membrane protein